MGILKKALCAVLITILIISAFSVPSSAKVTRKLRGEYAEGEVIVKLKSSAGSKFLKKKNAASLYGGGLSMESSSELGKKNKLKFVTLKSKSKTTAELVESLEDNENVEYAIPNYVKRQCSLGNDTYADFQWALKNNGNENGIESVDTAAPQLWDKSARYGKEQIVAVIDSGIDLTHEDLKDVLWTNPYGDELKGVHGYDFTKTVPSREPIDDNGHGTHIAGIIAAAANNNKGISGIAQSNVKIMALKASKGGDFYASDELRAFEYIEKAVSLGANIVAVNCSYGGESDINDKLHYDQIFDTLGSLGVMVCVASGNEYLDISDHSNGRYYSPACTDSKYAMTVGSTNERDEQSAFSNYGDKYVDIAAPGSNILSTVNRNCFNPSIYSGEQIDELCEYYQGYNENMETGDFGYPDILEVDGPVYTYYESEFFGKSGMSISFEPAKKGDVYFVEIPFKLKSDEGEYSVSFMTKFPEDSDCFIIDVPADYDSQNCGDEIIKRGFYFGSYGSDAWDHYVFESGTADENYKKGLDRKLVIYVSSSNGAFYLDDLAISKSDIDEDKFGKYDFMNGTSMSTPFVAGAAALIRSLRDSVTVEETISALKTCARYAPDLKGSVADCSSMYLKDVEAYINSSVFPTDSIQPESTEPSAAQPSDTEPSTAPDEKTEEIIYKLPEVKTKLTLFSYSEKLYVGKKYKIDTNVEYAKGKTKFKSSDSKIASVSSGGTVKAKKKGTAYITVSNNGSSKKLKITVKNPKLNKTSKTLRVGKSFKIKITGKVGAAKFVSSNKKIAAVSKSGKVKAKKKGRAVITVVTNVKIKLKCKIKVK